MIKKLFLLIAFILLSNYSAYSQKIFLTSENAYVKVNSISDWLENNKSNYTGDYCQAFYSVDEYGVACNEHLRINLNADKVIMIFFSTYEEGTITAYDTLPNTLIKDGYIYSDNSKGRFVELNIRNKYDTEKKVRGIMFTSNSSPDVTIFYEKEN